MQHTCIFILAKIIFLNLSKPHISHWKNNIYIKVRLQGLNGIMYMKKKPFFSSFPQIGIALSEVLKNQLSVFLSKSFLLLHRKGVTKRGDLADFWIQLECPYPCWGRYGNGVSGMACSYLSGSLALEISSPSCILPLDFARNKTDIWQLCLFLKREKTQERRSTNYLLYTLLTMIMTGT